MKERSVIMNSEELKILIESAREAKGISQRELAKLTGISRSTLNDLINGKIKKVDIDDLRKIAETLDMSLQKLLKAAGYDEMSLYFHAHKSKDKYIDKSSKDLKELIEKYKESELELLDFDTQKRRKVSDARQKLFYIMEHLQIMKDNKDSLYTIDKAIEDIKYAFDELEEAEKMYDKYHGKISDDVLKHKKNIISQRIENSKQNKSTMKKYGLEENTDVGNDEDLGL